VGFGEMKFKGWVFVHINILAEVLLYLIIAAMKRGIFLLCLVALLASCATVENNHDPLEGLNRGTEKFNDAIDRTTLKPVAKGYKAVTSKPVQNMVSNFYDNASYMNTVLNDFLQGKGQQGFEDFARFIINSTIGLAGIADVATAMGLDKHDEDFGQTLAVWGAGQGAYIVYPFLGPNSTRNTPDFITATATDATFWLSLALAPQITIPLSVLKYIDKRARALEASDMRDELSLDPYLFTREAWQQNREYLIYDGHPPATNDVKSSDSEDDWGDDAFDKGDAPVDEDPFDAPEAEPATNPKADSQYRPRVRMGTE